MQRRVSVDVDGVEIALCVQEKLGDLHAAGKRRPVKANVSLLKERKERNDEMVSKCLKCFFHQMV